MTGSSSGSLPQPQVNIPGHLPKLVGGFLSRDNNYWWPYDNQAMFFTGPAVATLNGLFLSLSPLSFIYDVVSKI